MPHTAVITGAAQNIGKGIATSLLKAGYTCVLLDKNEVMLRETAKELESAGKCHEYVLDITDIKGIDKFCDWLREQSLAVDTLINNVGYSNGESVLGLTPEQTRLSNQTNLEGPFYLTSLLTKAMVERKAKGNVIFISSVHSKVVRTQPMYSAAKAAIEMFVKESALELAQYGIRVNAVAPGPVVDTDSLQTNKYVPLGHYVQPQDIGESVAFLISDKARFITGQTLIVDGGFTIAHTHHWIKKGDL